MVHYRTPDGMVHIADTSSASFLWCILRCDPEAIWTTAKGEVDLTATCLFCLAKDVRVLHTADKCGACALAMENCPCDTPRCMGSGCRASCTDGD